MFMGAGFEIPLVFVGGRVSYSSCVCRGQSLRFLLCL